MGPFSALNHLINFALPSLFMAAVLPLLARVALGRAAVAWPKQFACQLVLGLSVQLLVLVITGGDGRMLAYLLLVVAMACMQLFLQTGGRAVRNPRR